MTLEQKTLGYLLYSDRRFRGNFNGLKVDTQRVLNTLRRKSVEERLASGFSSLDPDYRVNSLRLNRFWLKRESSKQQARPTSTKANVAGPKGAVKGAAAPTVRGYRNAPLPLVSLGGKPPKKEEFNFG